METHTHSADQSPPPTALSQTNRRRKISTDLQTEDMQDDTLMDAYCLSSTGLQRFPGEQSIEGGSAQKSVSLSRTAIGWLAKSFYVTLMEALWSMASAHRTLQKGTASHYPNTLRHTSPQVVPKIRLLGLASGTRVTAIRHNRQSANLMLLSDAFLSGRRITIAC